MNSNIPIKPEYGIYISQLVRIGRMCEEYSAFMDRNRMITDRLIKQGFRYSKLCKRNLVENIEQYLIDMELA